MTKHRRRDSIKSLLWSHIDPEKDEQLQGTKREVEDKVTKILKIIKHVDQDGRGGSREGDSGLELVELVEDLNGQYQSMYALYDNLRTELRKKVHGRKEKDSSSSSSSSDSESFYTSKEVDSNNGNLENELPKQTGHIKQDLGTGNAEGEVSAMTMSNKAHAYESSGRVKELENQVSSLQLELESVLAQERSLEERVERTAAEAKEQFEEILGLRARISELEMTSKEQGDELSALPKNNKNDSSSSTVDLTAHIKNLQLDVDSIRAQKSELKEWVLRNRDEVSTLVSDLMNWVNAIQQELAALPCQKAEPEEHQPKRNPEVLKGEKDDHALHNKFESGENDPYTQIMTLTAEINTLRVELRSLQTSKTQLENRDNELQTKIAEQQRTLQEQDDTINKMNQQCKQVKGLRKQSKVNLQATERKVEEIAEQFRKNVEDNLRLLAQRIRVAEKLHYENRDWYWTTREALKQEQIELQEKIAAHKAEFRKLKRMTMIVNDTLSGFDSMAERLGESNGIFLSRISKISEELLSARNWIKGTNNELKELKGEKLNLMKAVTQLEKRVGELEKMVKEKDERVLGLGEEKREAIRQLCVWIDYHRTDLHSLKILAKMSSRRPKTT